MYYFLFYSSNPSSNFVCLVQFWRRASPSEVPSALLTQMNVDGHSQVRLSSTCSFVCLHFLWSTESISLFEDCPHPLLPTPRIKCQRIRSTSRYRQTLLPLRVLFILWLIHYSYMCLHRLPRLGRFFPHQSCQPFRRSPRGAVPRNRERRPPSPRRRCRKGTGQGVGENYA